MENVNSNKIEDGKFFNIFNIIFISLVTIIVILPIWNIVVSSFSSANALAEGGITLLPKDFTLDNYKAVFRDSTIWKAFVISISKTVVGVVTHAFFTAMVAYGMSKNHLKGRKIYMTMGIITMFFSGGMVPTYLLIKSLGMLNSFWVYIIPALFSFYDMIIMMNFFRDIPISLEDSAKIDGAGVWRIFLSIILPLSKPVLATIAMFNGVWQWNDFMTAKLYINNEALYPVQMKLYEIIVEQQRRLIHNMAGTVILPTTSRSIQLATIVITTVPIVIIYPLLQKYFISGMMVGAIKE